MAGQTSCCPNNRGARSEPHRETGARRPGARQSDRVVTPFVKIRDGEGLKTETVMNFPFTLLVPLSFDWDLNSPTFPTTKPIILPFSP